MQVKLELLLTRTVTIHVVDHDLDDLGHLVQKFQTSDQENVHSMKIVEVNGRLVGTSLDSSNALAIGKDQNVAKLGQLVPALLQRLRKGLNKSKNDQSNADKSTIDHIESISHAKAWQDMEIARQHGHSMFGGRY